MKSHFKFSFLIVPLLVLWAAPSLFGQGTALTGAINGFVSDPSGAAIPEATIKVTNVGTGASFTGGTTNDGFYSMRFLVPGTYRVEVSKPGFSTMVVENVLVQGSSTPTVNAKLAVGTVAQSVTVTATNSLLEMQRADTGTTVENKLIDFTPSNFGVWMQQIYDTPGVVALASDRGYTAADTSGLSFSINGSGNSTPEGVGWHGQTSNELIDGMSTLSKLAGNNNWPTVEPTVDMTQELKVVSLPFSAEYGHTTGGVIIVTTKSGGKGWHGRGSEMNMPAGLRANTFTFNLAVPLVNRASGSTNHEVGRLGGAIKKDKLFVFGDFENWYQESNPSFLGVVPTAAMRQGNFTQSYYNSGTASAPVASVVSIYDPFSCATVNSGGVCTARNAVGSANDTYLPATTANVIPYSAWSPVAQALFPSGNPNKYINPPNSTGVQIGSTGKYLNTNNYYPPTNGVSQFRDWVGRMDYNLNNNNRLMLRYYHTLFSQVDPTFYPPYQALQVSDNNFPYIRQDDAGTIEYTSSLSSSSVVSFTLGFNRYSNWASDSYRNTITPQMLGFSPTFVAQSALDAAVPYISSTGGNYKGGTAWQGIGITSNNYNPDQTFQFYGLWSKVMGRHIIKVGGEMINERGYNQNGNYTAGAFNFDPEATEQVPLHSTPLGQGDAFASFLLGTSNSMSIVRPVETSRQAWDWGAYVQDDIKISPRLTINVGVRWDWSGAPTDRYNAMSGAFNSTVASPIATAVQTAAGVSNCAACVGGLVGGETFPGVKGLSRSPYDSTFLNFQPRLGIAFQLNSKTILRAGWGMFITQFEYDPGTTGFSATTTGTEYSPTDMPLNVLANPFPNGLVAATGSSLGLSTALGSSISFVDPHAREQRARMFNFNVQRLLSPNTVLSVGYLYTHGTHLAVNNNINHMTHAQLLACDATPTNCTAAVTNPFYGILPASSGAGLGAKTIPAYELYYSYPQFTSVTEMDMPIGDSEYHALEATLSRHFSHGVSLTVSYTNEKWQTHSFFANTSDPAPQKDVDPYDRPQELQANWVYQFPMGRGHFIGGNMSRWANAILGGWQWNVLFWANEGVPWNFSSNQAQPLTGVPVYNSPRSTDHWLNPAAWQVPTYPSQFPNVTWSMVDSHARMPRFHQADQGLQKSFKIKERVTGTLRIDFWNSFNTPDWFSGSAWSGSPSNRANSAFGTLSPTIGYTNNPRNGQLEGRLDF